jgi:DNA-binding PadR family transcriptional regulator
LETSVLGLLSEQPLHGYELKKRVALLMGPWSAVSFGSLYPALARLERSGFITSATEGAAPTSTPSGSLGAEVAAFRSRSVAAPGSRRGRKVYTLTPHGSERLRTLLNDAEGDDRSFAIRVAFCRLLTSQERIRLFERRHALLLSRARPSDRPGNREDRYRRSLFDFQNDRLAREEAWLASLLESERAEATESPVSITEGTAT